MADSNISGPTFDEHMGSLNGRKTYVVTLTDVAQRVCRVEASAFKPVIVEAQIYVNTLDATETVSVGTNSTSYNDLVSAASLGTADVFLPAANATGKLYFVADTDIYAIGSAGTDTGVITVILDLAGVNTATY